MSDNFYIYSICSFSTAHNTSGMMDAPQCLAGIEEATETILKEKAGVISGQTGGERNQGIKHATLLFHCSMNHKTVVVQQ